MEAESPANNESGLYKSLAKACGRTLLCHLYDTPEEQFTAAATFLRVGMERRERCVLLDGGNAAGIFRRLAALGPPFPAFLESGLLVVAHKQEGLLAEGVREFLESEMETALDDGFAALRVCADLSSSVTDAAPSVCAAAGTAWRRFFLENPASGLCQYDLARIPAESAHAIIAAHPLIVYGDAALENPFYPAPVKDGAPRGAEARQLLAMAAARGTAELRAKEMEEKYRAVVTLASDAVIFTGLDGEVTEANKKAMDIFGPCEGEIAGCRLRDFFAENDLPRLFAALRAAERAGEGQFTGFTALGKYGTPSPVDISVHLVEFGGRRLFKLQLRDAAARRRAENALRESGELYRQMFEQSNAVKLLIDARTGAIIDANGSAARFYGYTKEDLQRLKIFHLNTSPHEEVLEEMALAGEGKTAFFASRHRLASGEVRDVEEYAGPVTIMGRTLLHTIIHDVTERKRAEEKLKESEDRHRGLVEFLPDPLVVHAGGVIVYVNRAAAKLYGLKDPWDMAGKKVLDYIHPDYREIVADRMRTMAAKKEAVPMIEEKFLLANGHAIDVEVSAMPVKWEGKPAILSVFHDITEKKRIQREVREGEEKYRRLFNNVIDAIAIFDAETRQLLDANGPFKRVYGYSEEDFASLKVEDLSMDPEATRDAFMEVAKNPGPKILTRLHRTKEGTPIHTEIHTGSFPWEGRGAVYAVIRDISGRMEAARELLEARENAERATEIKDRFISLVSHELRGPLSSMLGFLKLIADDTERPPDPEVKKVLGTVIGSAWKMSEMIDALIGIVGQRPGKVDVRAVFIAPFLITAKAAAAVSYSADRKGVRIFNAVPPDARLYADPPLFYQVMLHLLSNAVKFCRQGDAVTVSFTEGERAAVNVSDTGIGIDAERLPRLFNYKLDNPATGTAGEKGSGLGLSFCMDVMRAHGGDIRAASRPGEGASLTAEFPRVHPLLLAAAGKTAAEAVRNAVVNCGVDIAAAHTGAEAMEKAGSLRPHIILVEDSLADMDGAELVRKLKSDSRLGQTPVIVFSGARDSAREEALGAGADDFISAAELPGGLAARLLRLMM